MGDLISREDAIQILSERAKSLQGISGDLGGACSGAVKIIKSLPSAEPEQKWFPVTEALPEEETTVLVTVHYDGDKYYRYKPNDYVTTAEYISDRWCFADEEFIMQLHKHHVIAWAPLPKPWEG